MTWWHVRLTSLTDRDSPILHLTRKTVLMSSLFSPWKYQHVSLSFSLCFINTPHYSVYEGALIIGDSFLLKQPFDLPGLRALGSSGDLIYEVNTEWESQETSLSLIRLWYQDKGSVDWRERGREGEPGAPALSTGLTGRRQRFYCSWQNIWSVTCEVSPFTHHYVMTSLAWLVSVGGETLWQMSSTVRRWVRDHNTEHTVVFTLAVTGGRRGGVRAASAVTLTDWLPPVPASPALYRLR